MKKLAMFAGLAMLLVAAVASAENPQIYDLPQFTQAPFLDGDKATVAGEWDNTLQLECSPSLLVAHGAEYGWRDQESQQTEVGGNQLVASETEDAAEARTDADYAAQIYQALDAEAFYFLVEARDNIRDVTGAGTETNWWERDSMTLYIDLVNSREEWGGAGYVYERARLNLINFVAAPQASSSVTVTWERLIQDERTPTQDPDEIEGLEYGFADMGDAFGGEADYLIEGKVPWTTLLRYNLPEVPGVGSEMSLVWLAPDPDDSEGFGGQIQCYGWGDNPADFATIVFSDIPAGPSGTNVEADSWGGIKATFR
jgi:hypothetical protein